VTGIGFLGAGAIIKEGASIRGLTTAASLWTAAAIGMAVGAGEYVFAVAGAIIIEVALGPVGALSARLAPRSARPLGVRLRVRSIEVVDAVGSQLSQRGIEITGVASTPLEGGRFDVEIQFQIPGKTTVAKVMSVIFSAPGVEAAETLTASE
jgi:putative Mg2+ transporter-C (MgtC) family protein